MKKPLANSLWRAFAILAFVAAPCWAAAQTGSPNTPPASGAPTPGAAAPGAPAMPPPPPPPPPLSNEEASYLIGVNYGEQLHRLGVTNEVTIDAIGRGLKDGLGGKTTTPVDQHRLQDFVRSISVAVTARNRAAAQDFLSRNGREKDVKTTASGLQYKILAAGDAKGAAPGPTDQVSVQYRGKLLDGTEFDSSYSRGQPATFQVNGMIKGWQEALVMMKPGAKWQLFVPPELAYGMMGRPHIPGGSLLIFEVELLGVKPPAPPSPSPSPSPPSAVRPMPMRPGPMSPNPPPPSTAAPNPPPPSSAPPSNK